jgi:hypothetical protein
VYVCVDAACVTIEVHVLEVHVALRRLTAASHKAETTLDMASLMQGG